MGDVEFRVGDKVRWGTAEGVVIEHGREDSTFAVDFNGSRVWFFDDGSYIPDLPGQPLLELIERPKKKRKVKMWRWEKVFKVSKGDGGLYLEQSTGLLCEDSWQAKNGWTKVPGSERDVDVEDWNENEAE